MFRKIFSVRIGVVLLGALSVCMVLGAVVMPLRPGTYARINDQLLFDWLRIQGTGLDNAWFWCALFVLGVLAIHTLVCSVDSLLRTVRAGGNVVLRISPHVMHLGFLLILLGHLVSAGWGFRASGALPEGRAGMLPDGTTLLVRSVDMKVDPGGFPRDWSAEVSLFRGRTELAKGMLGANRPLFHRGVGIYLKSLAMSRLGPQAVLVINRDPGAVWVLAGAIVFTIGNVLLLALKIRREEWSAGVSFSSAPVKT